MAEVVRMPKMSDTMTEGVLVAWHKKVGDKIKSGDLLAEIETDKAVMEFESFQEGTLLYIGAEKGAAIKVDSIIAILGKEGEDYKTLLVESDAAKPAEVVAKKEEAPAKKEVADIKEEAPVQKEEKVYASVITAEQQTDQGRIKASPLAKKIAKDKGITLSKVKGSGDEGRIVRRDVEKLVAGKSAASFQSPAIVEEESYDEVPVSLMRKTIARRLAESKFSAPHFYLTLEINMDRCADMRDQINTMFPEVKVSFNDIIIKASALALKKNSKVNSSWLTDKIRYNHHVHIGMAVAVEEGLLVPVIRFADQKSFAQISDEAKSFAAKAKDKKLQPDEMQGNTFTISNLGMMDIDEFTAIINPPDACIMAIGKIKKQAVVVNEEIKIANVLKVTLSCDHRVVDGATGAKFLQSFKQMLENPVSMLY
ncbi:MAG: pyruvate dehydrogenase complex dihydrolipoamide acetyltransferase [Chitinophagales bacterium]|nr:pyruvate dehydrogenase complex dihydrolipoamide acetyltransferase [Chitinophagales bacterium]